MTMTNDERDVAFAAVKAYFNSRTFGIAPISCRRAIEAIRPIVGDRPADPELIELILAYAMPQNISVEYESR